MFTEILAGKRGTFVHTSTIKHAFGLAALAMALAAVTIANAQEMPVQPDNAPEAATAEQMDGACKAVGEWMKKPGLAVMLQDPRINPNPDVMRSNLQAACNFPESQWAAIPDTSKMTDDVIGPSYAEVCNNMHGLIHGGSIGILGVLGGGPGKLNEGHEMFHTLCMNGGEAAEDSVPEGPTPPEGNREESSGAPTTPATPQQIENACARLEKGIEKKHPGLLFMFKGSDTHPQYKPQHAVNAVAASCGQKFLDAVNNAQKPVFNSKDEAYEQMMGQACRSLDFIITKKKDGAYDPDREGIFHIVAGSEYAQVSFGYTCGGQPPPPRNMPVPSPAK